VLASVAGGAAPRDHAALALNVLPPGEAQNRPHLTDQIALYDGLTPKQGDLTAADLRRFYLQLLRGPGRIAALDVPGLDAFGLATSGRQFVPSAPTEAFLARQAALLRASGARGRQVLGDVDAYVAGINAYFRTLGGSVAPFTRNDVTAIGALIGAVFGAGGGDEARRSELFSAPGSRGLARERRA